MCVERHAHDVEAAAAVDPAPRRPRRRGRRARRARRSSTARAWRATRPSPTCARCTSSTPSCTTSCAPPASRVAPGEMGENVTTRGVDLLGLPERTRLRLGAERRRRGHRPAQPVRRSSIGLQPGPHGGDARPRRRTASWCARPASWRIVLAGGDVRPGDAIAVELPAGPHRAADARLTRRRFPSFRRAAARKLAKSRCRTLGTRFAFPRRHALTNRLFLALCLVLAAAHCTAPATSGADADAAVRQLLERLRPRSERRRRRRRAHRDPRQRRRALRRARSRRTRRWPRSPPTARARSTSSRASPGTAKLAARSTPPATSSPPARSTSCRRRRCARTAAGTAPRHIVLAGETHDLPRHHARRQRQNHQRRRLGRLRARRHALADGRARRRRRHRLYRHRRHAAPSTPPAPARRSRN